MIKIPFLALAVLAIVAGGAATNAHAEMDLTVVHVMVAGKPVQSAPNVLVTLPNELPTKRPVKNGDGFRSGTTFSTPEDTALTLKSVNGNLIGVAGNTTARLAASKQGELHTNIWGKLWFVVKEKLSFFATKDASGKFQAAALTTRFSMEIRGTTVKFEQTEGDVVIKKAVRIKVGNESVRRNGGRQPEATRTSTSELSANVREKVYKLDNHEEDVENFRSFDDALTSFFKSVERGEREGDKVLVAESYTTLGYLFLAQKRWTEATEFFHLSLKNAREIDPNMTNPAQFRRWIGLGRADLGLGQSEQALATFEKALLTIKNIDPADPLNAEALLGRAEAQFKLGRDEEARSWVTAAKWILGNDVAKSLEALELAGVHSGDENMAWRVARHIIDDYHDLAWASSLEGNTKRRDKYLHDATMLERYFKEGFKHTGIDPDSYYKLLDELNKSIRREL